MKREREQAKTKGDLLKRLAEKKRELLMRQYGDGAGDESKDKLMD